VFNRRSLLTRFAILGIAPAGFLSADVVRPARMITDFSTKYTKAKDIAGIIRQGGLKPGLRKLVEGLDNGALKMLAMVHTVWIEDVTDLRKAPLVSADVLK
jgi:hypothetical protein